MRDVYEEFNDERTAGSTQWLVWTIVVAALCFTAGGYSYLREVDGDRDVVGYAGTAGVLRAPVIGELSTVSVRAATTDGRAVGTAGTTGATPTDTASESAATIKELETITGTNDGHELVGRKVDLHVPVQSRANNVSFWVGEKDNRMLVVMDRDRRTPTDRQRGAVADNPISPTHAGQQADITGTIQKLPRVEAMYSWGLSRDDWNELASRPLYIRADAVRSEDSRE